MVVAKIAQLILVRQALPPRSAPLTSVTVGQSLGPMELVRSAQTTQRSSQMEGHALCRPALAARPSAPMVLARLAPTTSCLQLMGGPASLVPARIRQRILPPMLPARPVPHMKDSVLESPKGAMRESAVALLVVQANTSRALVHAATALLTRVRSHLPILHAQQLPVVTDKSF